MVWTHAAAARAEFHKTRHGQALTPEQTARLGEQAAHLCLTSPEAFDEAVLLLFELATLPNPELARGGVDGIFRHAVESMADAFEPRLCNLYIQFLGRLLQHCRALPEADWLDRQLRHFGLPTEQDLIRRAQRVRRTAKVRGDCSAVQKVLVLSRVTLGADVAITSLVLKKMMRACPAARLVLLANHKAALLFAGESRVTARPVDYPRGGGLLHRLASWPAVVEAVEEELKGLRSGQYLVVDPDSRFTQLGLLPVLAEESAYRFFESRSFSRPGLETLTELTAAWLEEVFGPDATALQPWVSLPPEAMQFARAVRASSLAGRLLSMNLGVGDNPRKRLDDPFEQHLVEALLGLGWSVLLDKGEGREETARVDRLLSRLRETGRRVAEIVERGSLPPPGAEVVAWRGSLAGFGALIGVSDLYIGYDSAGGHIAAAQGVKAVDIFAGFRSARMPQRWRPSGPGEVRQIVVDPNSAVDADKILSAVLEATR